MLSRLTNPLWKLVAFLYYRSFGETTAFSRWAAPRVRAWERRTARGDAPLASEAWEAQYRDGRWDYLGEEANRYRGLADLIARHRPNASILDVGCGDGALVAELRSRFSYRAYLGLDISAVAIERAERRGDPSTRFQVADAEQLEPTGAERFDAIVFNESLYYFDDPLAAAERYRALLAPAGHFFLSMFSTRRALAILSALGKRYRVIEERQEKGQRGTWHQVVLDPF